jgi:predicted small secreted protein
MKKMILAVIAILAVGVSVSYANPTSGAGSVGLAARR